MTSGLIPLLRAVAASEIAKAFGGDDGLAPAKAEMAAPQAARAGLPPGPPPDPLIAILQTVKLSDQPVGLAGLAAPRALATLADAALPPPPLAQPEAPGTLPSQPGAAQSAAQSFLPPRGATGAPPLADATGSPAASAPLAQAEPPGASSAMRGALAPAMADAMSYGAFPFTLGGSGASAAALVIFNAAMAPSWPPPLRLDQLADGAGQIRIAGSQLAQMTPEETAEFLAKMAAMFGFLLVVKKRLSRSMKEEKESILGLFALFGVAMDTLIKGMHLAFDLTTEQQAVLERITVENGGNPSGRGGSGRHRLKL